MPEFDPIDVLRRRLTKEKKWPPRSEARAWRTVLEHRAFLDNDRDALARIAKWTDKSRPYKIDPLAETIADAWSDHLFSEELNVSPANEADEERMAELIGEELEGGEGNELTDALKAAERDYVVAEGEAWWRWSVDPDVADKPLLEWHSRASIAPLYIGGRLVACALVSILEGEPNIESAPNAVFRHFEFHADGRVVNAVYRGTGGDGREDRLGQEVDLTAHPETEDLEEEWRHGLPMLMGRIINKRGRDPRLGVSEFAGIRDYLLELNEALTIGGENMRLTAKKRVVVSSSTVQASAGWQRPADESLIDNGDGSFVRADGRPQFNAGEDVLVSDELNEELGRESKAPFQVLEYSFDADALIAHKRDLVETAVTRLGLTPQWLGLSTGDGDGYALSGTALRLRLIPTTKRGNGKGKTWDRALPHILSVGALLDDLEAANGGLGNQWTDPAGRPGVERGNPLPVDEVEEATVEATLVGAGVRSVWQSVRNQHPEWSEDEVDEEVTRIREDKKASAPALPGFGVTPPPPGDDEDPDVDEDDPAPAGVPPA